MEEKNITLSMVEEEPLLEWTEEFEDMMVEDVCPKCGWVPDCDDHVISYGPREYSYVHSLLSSFPQYIWSEIYSCPECSSIFKAERDI